MRKLINLAALSFAALAAVEAGAGAQPAQDYLAVADRLLNQGNAAGALTTLASGSPTRGDSAAQAAHFGLACRAHLANDAPELARDNCLRAIDAGTTRDRWRDYNNLGVAEFRRGDIAAARRAFRTAVVLAGVAYSPQKNLALVSQLAQDAMPRAQLAEALVVR
ncbi:hypothetical protein E4634_13570 [Mangrovimicrobium sediminis]|uniref:Tetratricopeptide repeat protein n=1 Tax=Mangrovimicrobium sediminis TaxID=2562682 RepID=A0A4Z0LYX5_9GAMM|nr:hypothetical protein [Haliea sp. SAOS-164]TGD72552.1 hypothetical protein E4634_13570 [Haliea sp. SAOS-164]